jgi:hypothetical protein
MALQSEEHPSPHDSWKVHINLPNAQVHRPVAMALVEPMNLRCAGSSATASSAGRLAELLLPIDSLRLPSREIAQVDHGGHAPDMIG